MGVKLKADYIKKRLRKIVNNMQDLSPVMKYIGNDMLNETIDNFDKEQSYDGVKWKKSKRALKESGKTLQ
ncbi:MAG: phage virion morphogenesis protein, partial [Cetobacterium sp.]